MKISLWKKWTSNFEKNQHTFECQLFVYIFSCLFTFVSCLFAFPADFQSFVYFLTALCLHFQMFFTFVSCLFLLLSADFQRLFLNLKNDWEYLLNSAFLVFQVGSHPYWPIFSKRHFAFHYSSLKQGRRSSSRWWYYPRDLPK